MFIMPPNPKPPILQVTAFQPLPQGGPLECPLDQAGRPEGGAPGILLGPVCCLSCVITLLLPGAQTANPTEAETCLSLSLSTPSMTAWPSVSVC